MRAATFSSIQIAACVPARSGTSCFVMSSDSPEISKPAMAVSSAALQATCPLVELLAGLGLRRISTQASAG